MAAPRTPPSARTSSTSRRSASTEDAAPPTVAEPIDWMTADPGLRAATLEHYADAELYDHEYRRRRADVNWYRALAAGRLPGMDRPMGVAGSGGAAEVLELGCGSGRLLVPLARDGLRVVGMDLSLPMLRRLRQRLDHLPQLPRSRAVILRADFRRFTLGRKFPLIVCPFNAMQHLYTRDDVERFLARVREHLLPGGTFAFDVLNPDLKWLTRDPEKRWSRTRFKDPRDGRTYYYSTNHAYDAATQINWIRIFYDEAPPAGAGAPGRAAADRGEQISRRSSPSAPSSGQIPGRRPARVIHLAQRQFFPEELRALLEYNGFTVDHREGGFAGEAFDTVAESQVCRCSIRRGSRR